MLHVVSACGRLSEVEKAVSYLFFFSDKEQIKPQFS